LIFNSGVGVNISKNKLDFVYLKGSFKGIELIAESSYSINENLSVVERMNEIADVINRFSSEQQLSHADIYFAIPSRHSIVREIEFPLAVKENLRSTLQYEMEKYVPVEVDDIYFDFQTISEDKAASKLKILLVVIKKTEIDPYLQLADRLHTGVSGIQILPAAVSNFYFYHQKTLNKTAIIIFWSSESIDVMVTRDDRLIYSKSHALSGVSGEDDINFLNHMARVKETFFNEEQKIPLIHFGAPPSKELVSQLDDAYESVPQPSSGYFIKRNESIPSFGAALQMTQKTPVQINMMPPRHRKKPDKTGYHIMLGLAGLIVLSGILWAASYLVNRHNTLNYLNEELNRLRSQATVIEKMSAELSGKNQQIEQIASLRAEYMYAVSILSELSDRIPETAWVKNLNLSENKLTLSGSAESAYELITLLEASPLFREVSFLSDIRKGIDETEVFRIGLKVNNQIKGD